MSKRLPPSEYRRRMATIKPYVDFNLKGGTRQSKSLISRYFNKLNPLIERGYKPKGAANVKNKKLIAETFDVDYRRRLKAIPVPPEVTNVRIRQSKISYSRSGIKTISAALDKKAFAIDTAAYVNRFTRRLGGNRFRIRAGKYYIPGTYDRSALIDAIQNLQKKYGNWEDWIGIEAVDVDEDYNDGEE